MHDFNSKNPTDHTLNQHDYTKKYYLSYVKFLKKILIEVYCMADHRDGGKFN